MPDELTFRSPRPDELHAYMAPLYLAFGEVPSSEQLEAERGVMEFDRSVGALDGNEWVATAGAYSMRLTVPGGEVAVSAITGVGVRPDFRRQGLLRQMMDWLFDDARKHEEPVAVLLASEAAIYQRFGFGQASMASSFSFDPTSTTFRRPVDLRSGCADQAGRSFGGAPCIQPDLRASEAAHAGRARPGRRALARLAAA